MPARARSQPCHAHMKSDCFTANSGTKGGSSGSSNPHEVVLLPPSLRASPPVGTGHDLVTLRLTILRQAFTLCRRHGQQGFWQDTTLHCA